MSKPKPNLTAIFGKYVGQTLKDPDRITCDMDSVLLAMQADATKNGLELRVLFPGKMADFGNNSNRANVFVEQDAGGKLRVANKFNFG